MIVSFPPIGDSSHVMRSRLRTMCSARHLVHLVESEVHATQTLRWMRLRLGQVGQVSSRVNSPELQFGPLELGTSSYRVIKSACDISIVSPVRLKVVGKHGSKSRKRNPQWMQRTQGRERHSQKKPAYQRRVGQAE